MTKHRSKTYAIAEQVGVSVRTVRRYLGGSSREWYHRLSDAEVERAVAGLKQGAARCPGQPRRHAPPFGQMVLSFE